MNRAFSEAICTQMEAGGVVGSFCVAVSPAGATLALGYYDVSFPNLSPSAELNRMNADSIG